MKQERTRIAVQNQTQAAELEARKAEYQDLPLTPLEFMPVTIEVAVTETESEKKAQVALAEIIGSNSDLVASAVGNAATGLLSKSVGAADLKLDADGAAPETLDEARGRYFDALLAARSAPRAAEAQQSLTDAKRQYNEARRTLGLEAIK